MWWANIAPKKPKKAAFSLRIGPNSRKITVPLDSIDKSG